MNIVASHAEAMECERNVGHKHGIARLRPGGISMGSDLSGHFVFLISAHPGIGAGNGQPDKPRTK